MLVEGDVTNMDLDELIRRIEEARKDHSKLSELYFPTAGPHPQEVFHETVEASKPEEIDAYLDVLAFSIESDRSNLPTYARQELAPPDEEQTILPLTSHLLYLLPPALSILVEDTAREAYKELVHAGKTIDARFIIAKDSLPFLPLLKRKSYRRTYLRIIKKACELARPDEAFPSSYALLNLTLPHLDSLNAPERVERFLHEVDAVEPRNIGKFISERFSQPGRDVQRVDSEEEAENHGLWAIGRVSRATVARLNEVLKRKEGKVNRIYHAFLHNFMQRYLHRFVLEPDTGVQSEEVIDGTIPYVEALPAETLEEYLALINDSVPNAPRDIRRWLRTGLRCVECFGSDKARRYFKYKLKSDDEESKIDELSAMGLLLDSHVPGSSNEIFNSELVLFTRPEKDVGKALLEAAGLIYFFHHINKIKRRRKGIEERIERLKKGYEDYSEFVEPLCRTRGRLFATPPPDSWYYSEEDEEEREKKKPYVLRGEPPSYVYPYGPAKRSYSPLEQLRDEIDTFNRWRREGYTPKFRTVKEFLNNALSPAYATAILEHYLQHRHLRGDRFEMLRDRINDLKTRLSAVGSFDELRVEINACFLDDIVDRIGCCISGEGSDREAALVYKLDRNDDDSRNSDILSLNAYSKGAFVECLGKVLLVDVEDKKDGERKLLVDGVIIGPEIRFVRDQTTKTRFNWESFVGEAIERYAETRWYKNLLVNTSHSTGQQCTHDFVKAVADAFNFETGKCLIEYEMVPKGGHRVFHLKRPQGQGERPPYTHNIEKRQMAQSTISRTRRGDWNGESYFHTWHRYSGGQAWNACRGETALLELPADLSLFGCPF